MGAYQEAWRALGPAFLVAVAYLDPGNWATAIEAGSRYGYSLVWVVVLSNLLAILLQTLSARLGICTGKHLAQVCRESYPPAVIWILWATCEISIVALDLTMLLGTAVGLNLLLGWPLLPCILLTGLDVVLLLLLVPHQGAIKKSEALTVGLLVIVVGCFLVDLAVSQPPLVALLGGLKPVLRAEHLYCAVSLLGANVMPHSFYLHSALVSGQARGVAAAAAAAAETASAAGTGNAGDSSNSGKKAATAGTTNITTTTTTTSSTSTNTTTSAAAAAAVRQVLSRLCFLNFCDISIALAVALVVNVSVLLVAAAAFHARGITVETLQDAHDVMERTLSSSVAPRAFGMALLCAGQLSTFTGTIAGQVVLQGFLNVHISTWARRLITRSAAIAPAAVLQWLWGDRATYKFLLIAQVALALQLPVTLVPLIKATSSKAWMGPFRSSAALAATAWAALGLIFCANVTLLLTQMVTGVEQQTPTALLQPASQFAMGVSHSGGGTAGGFTGGADNASGGFSWGLGLLQPDGPLDAFLDGLMALAWRSPLRGMGLLALIISGASFLALQLWMIVTPLPGPESKNSGEWYCEGAAAGGPSASALPQEPGSGPDYGGWSRSGSARQHQTAGAPGSPGHGHGHGHGLHRLSSFGHQEGPDESENLHHQRPQGLHPGQDLTHLHHHHAHHQLQHQQAAGNPLLRSPGTPATTLASPVGALPTHSKAWAKGLGAEHGGSLEGESWYQGGPSRQGSSPLLPLLRAEQEQEKQHQLGSGGRRGGVEDEELGAVQLPLAAGRGNPGRAVPQLVVGGPGGPAHCSAAATAAGGGSMGATPAPGTSGANTGVSKGTAWTLSISAGQGGRQHMQAPAAPPPSSSAAAGASIATSAVPAVRRVPNPLQGLRPDAPSWTGPAAHVHAQVEQHQQQHQPQQQGGHGQGDGTGSATAAVTAQTVTAAGQAVSRAGSMELRSQRSLLLQSQGGPATAGGTSSLGTPTSSSRAGLSRGARRQIAATLDDWFGQYYDSHGQYTAVRQLGGAGHAAGAYPGSGSANELVALQGGAGSTSGTAAGTAAVTEGAQRPSGMSPLLCHHTQCAHLCTSCSQALYQEVQRAVAALAEIEGALAALLPNPAHHASLLARAPGVSAPASTQACAWHEAAVACLAAADLPALAHFVQGLYTSQMDDSRILATMPLALTAGSPSPATPTSSAVGVSSSSSAQRSGAGQPQQAGSGAGAEGAGLGILPSGFFLPVPGGPWPQVPMNRWCVVGPASFISFGIWAVFALVQLCQSEARPELWGRYASALNKGQGLLRDARLEVATTPSTAASGGGAQGGDAAHASNAPGLSSLSSRSSSGGAPGTPHGAAAGGSAAAAAAGAGGQASFLRLPASAAQLEGSHVAALRLELARCLQLLELALGDRRGPQGAEVAFSKGKEIMQSVIKRWRKRLGYPQGF